jgi:hypothetical protein
VVGKGAGWWGGVRGVCGGGVRTGADLALVIVGEGLDELDEAETAVEHDVPLLLEHGRLGGSKWVVSGWYVVGSR